MSRLLVIEDHALVREGLVTTLKRLGEDVEILQAGDAESAIRLLEDKSEVDLVLLDLMLPGMNGFSFLNVLRKRFPALPVVVVSALEDWGSVQRAARLGAAAFVPKSCNSEELLGAVSVVLGGGERFPESVLIGGSGVRRRSGRNVATRFGLSAAQARVLDLLVAGKSNREIAGLLGLTEGTVKVHLSAIYRALDVNSRAQALVVVARCRGSF